jgi:hypothetical protein
MPLKRADHHHLPIRTFWTDGRDGVLFTMEDATVERANPIRCFVTREALDALRGDLHGDLLSVFAARCRFLEEAAGRAYDSTGKPREIVLTEENYPQLRDGLYAA